ncbi:MAG: TraR/DksA family transcriptional regulator [Elusimicrobiota bacterium]
MKNKPAAKNQKPSRPAHSTASVVKPGLLPVRNKLLTMRAEVMKAAERQEIAANSGTSVGDTVDEASMSIERELLFELSDSERSTLDQIEAALRKIDRGSYGICESCRKPIAKLRLKTLPFARYCIECQSGVEKMPESGADPLRDLQGGNELSPES